MVHTGPGSDGVRVRCVFPPHNVVAGASECDILLGVTTVVPLPIPLRWKATTLHTCKTIFKKRGASTMESGPQYIYILQSFVFSRENYMLSSVMYVLSCYITCIAHTLHINGI